MFDIAGFRELILKAKGDMTSVEFAKKSGVNRTYISKFINEKKSKPPSPDVIKRIAESSQERVDYLDLLKAAGYFEEKHYESGNLENNRFIEDLKEAGIDIHKLPKEKYKKLIAGIRALWDMIQ